MKKSSPNLNYSNYQVDKSSLNKLVLGSNCSKSNKINAIRKFFSAWDMLEINTVDLVVMVILPFSPLLNTGSQTLPLLFPG